MSLISVVFNITDLPTYRIVGDNCDLHQKPNHETLTRRTKEHHWFNLYAVRDRIHGLEMADGHPQTDASRLMLSKFLPNEDDCRALRKDFIILVARVLVKYLPWFSAIKPAVADHIPHRYSNCMGQKSDIVSLFHVVCLSLLVINYRFHLVFS